MSDKTGIVTALLLTGVFVFSGAEEAGACSAVVYRKGGETIVGRNFDWPDGTGRASYNPKGQARHSLYLQDGSSGAVWRASLSSFTFDLVTETGRYGKVSGPVDAINEKGLWIAALWMGEKNEGPYPALDKRLSLTNWEVVPFLLDQAGSVDEALRLLKTVRIAGTDQGKYKVRLHWLLADAAGACAGVEFVEGRLEMKRPSLCVMTNNSLSRSLKYLAGYKDFGGTAILPPKKPRQSSLDRYVRAAAFIAKAQDSRSHYGVPSMLKDMRLVTQSPAGGNKKSQSRTQWTVAYDLKARSIYWFTLGNPALRRVKLADYNSVAGETVSSDISSPMPVSK